MSVESGHLVCIGGSAGSFEVLNLVLPRIPADFSLPVVVMMHIPAEPPSSLATLFASRCQVSVREAEDKDAIENGVIYFAPPNYHLLIERGKTFALSIDPPVNFSRPSIDVLFESVAESMGPEAIGILLSGANSDGALGLRAIAAAGGLAVVQDPQTAQTKEMPAAGLNACPGARILSVEEIGAFLSILINGAAAGS